MCLLNKQLPNNKVFSIFNLLALIGFMRSIAPY